MAANKEQDIDRIGAAMGQEVSQLTRTGAVGNSSDMVAHLYTLLQSLQRSGRLIARQVLPEISADPREAIADPVPAAESDMTVDESSLVCVCR